MTQKQRRQVEIEAGREFYRREQDRKAERRRNRQIKELEQAAARPAILPSTDRWIAAQIERLRSGAAVGQGSSHG